LNSALRSLNGLVLSSDDPCVDVAGLLHERAAQNRFSDGPLLNALPNCASRSHLGLAASRWRGRHRIFAARRHGDRRRRNGGGGAASNMCCGTIAQAAWWSLLSMSTTTASCASWRG